ncbi:MAG: hypothetical protein V4719_29555 [Planctomycetota bacterium]
MAKVAVSAPKPSRLTIYDCQSTFQMVDRAREHAGGNSDDGEFSRSVSFDYGAAEQYLNEARVNVGLGSAELSIAIATSDPASEAQSRFFTALHKKGILVEQVDFRHATPTLPLGAEYDRSDHKQPSVATQISYALGILTARESPEVVIVTRCFEIYGPVLDFVSNRGGKAAIAFFRRSMDGRWAQNGLFDPDSPVAFIDLEPVSRLLLGVDLREVADRKARKGGLAGI